ncbi:folylpolyglutamate synthase/dihydrofolate synthase family protein [Pontixanthobacter gangjinensis]|uniref:Bifunctional folylpolyglutamate synthase/dihydrofolate synthase n=1 Tax=Pontixanthobacter gangjinensis TaxID=1028742 RepID=A0A6I4SLW7_9SPHN|nr:folylpolyglutamate synthase/dihydrofolate synthase family protein [Pontixanthobacter gangjinensis]MXO56735.1 bifunctional folylpolyglutamate synthase/dihydrofolate synthase [Pontixanthobacter gangjinensis]
MKDFGRSDDPAVQAQLDRLAQLSLPQGRMGLQTIRDLLDQLGDPQDKLPPVFHVAGTNGKGSTCAFLRAILEADGKIVHATTSPHLVRYNERIRIAGKLIEDKELAPLLEEVLDAAVGLDPSFFEVTIAAAFLAFSRAPADACIVEVGLGGRFDATNVLKPEAVAACGIAALGIDHERFLLTPEDDVPKAPLQRIAFEKAGILKSGTGYAALPHADEIEAVIAAQAEKVGALHFGGWAVSSSGDGFAYHSAHRSMDGLPEPSLPGDHQRSNAGLAIAMLEIAGMLPSTDAVRQGLRNVRWSARLQRLSRGPLTDSREIWLDGGHNPSAGEALAKHFAGQRLHLILGMIEGKDPGAIVGPLRTNIESLTAVPISTHNVLPAAAYGENARSAPSIGSALAALPDDGLPVLIAGSLYLAGDVLRLNDELPD